MKFPKQEIWHMRQGIHGLQGLEKINSVAFLEGKVSEENPCVGWKLLTYNK